MKEQSARDHEACITAIQDLVHEICDEPGPCFSCYSVCEDCEMDCINCEIHWCGMKKPAIHINREQLEKCMKSNKGKVWMKEHLRNEIGDLITEESWYETA